MSQLPWACVQMPCRSGSASSTCHAPLIHTFLTALVTYRSQNYLLTYEFSHLLPLKGKLHGMGIFVYSIPKTLNSVCCSKNC